jgi:glycerol-3-phosphate acyltransferase PlsY
VSALAFPRGIAVLAVLFLTLGDPAAAVFGIWKGRTRFRGKSVEGDLACLVICLVIAVIVTWMLPDPLLVVGIAGAVFASLFQALPVPLNDNLTIPVGSGIGMAIISALMR